MSRLAPFAVVLAVSTALGLSEPGPRPTVSDSATLAVVTRVIDGDTVVLRLDGKEIKTRLIGVDAPESVDPRKPVERFAVESATFLRELVEGKPVRIAYEPAGARVDRYGRLLAYAYLQPEGLFVNRELVARGYAFAYTKYPFRFMDDFRAAERQAREKGLGLWGPDPAPEKVSPAAVVYITKTGTRYHRAGCRALSKSSTAIRLGDVGGKFEPCAVCDPPKLP